MTFLAASKQRTNSVPIAPSHLPDSSVSNSRILEYINASHDELLDAARNSDGCAFAESSAADMQGQFKGESSGS